MPARYTRPAADTSERTGTTVHGVTDSVDLAEPRPLRPEELRVLRVMLSVEFEGAGDLRSQVPTLRVSGHCGCGCPSICFSHPQDEVGTWHRVNAAIAGTYDGIALFTSGRWLDSMEYIWTTDAPTSVWPPVELLAVTPCS